uniref:Glutamate rich 6 n=1 Tax=Laticauda laticaudata TaxID=8630 RepID=A0A8C5RKY0_LATLA
MWALIENSFFISVVTEHCNLRWLEDFLKLFKESLQTISSVGPPTILAYRPESSRADIHIEVMALPTYLLCEWGNVHLSSCEKNRFQKKMEMIDVAPHKAHGSQADRERAKERARQRYGKLGQKLPLNSCLIFYFVDNKQLKTISFFLSQETPSAIIYPQVIKKTEILDNTYSISCCDFTIAGGKLVKNEFIQQYYKNGVKFLTMFPDGTAQIFYPSGNLAIIVVQNENAGYICIVQEDKHEKPKIQAVFDSCGKGTCYHPNQIVWINITIRGGHYSDQAGNKVKTWIWPNNLQKHNPRVSFKPIFLSLNLNVGVRILGQDKIAISFLAMGKQAKINVGTKVQPLAEHLPWPKYIAEDDLLLFANRLKILRIFAKLNRYLDFPASDWWTKLQLPSFLLKQTSKLIYLCKECEIGCSMDKLIMAIVKSPV